MNYFASHRARSNQGFTLIEILVVIAIIGILSSVLLFNMAQSRAKARDAQRLSDLKELQVALEQYYIREKAYPDDLDAVAPYIDDLPHDPKTGEPYEYMRDVDNDLFYAIQAVSDDESMTCQMRNTVRTDIVGFGTDVPDCPFRPTAE